jgi:hypothetical protein
VNRFTTDRTDQNQEFGFVERGFERGREKERVVKRVIIGIEIVFD